MIWLSFTAWSVRAHLLMLDISFVISLCIVHSLCCLRHSCVRPVGYSAVCLSPRYTQYHTSCMVSGTPVHLILPTPSMAVAAAYFFLHARLLPVHGGFQSAILLSCGLCIPEGHDVIVFIFPRGNDDTRRVYCVHVLLQFRCLSCVGRLQWPYISLPASRWAFSGAVAKIFCSKSSMYKFAITGQTGLPMAMSVGRVPLQILYMLSLRHISTGP